MESLSLVSTFMQNASASATNLLQTEEAMKLKEAERMPSWLSWFRQSACRDFDSTQVCYTISFTCGGKFTIHKIR